jgi:hypothetical protein
MKLFGSSSCLSSRTTNKCFLTQGKAIFEYKKTGSVRYAEDVTLFRRRALEKILLRFGD